MTKEQEPNGQHFDIEMIPKFNGALVDLNEDSYVELYQDLDGLSSAVWSTDFSADNFIEEAESLIGEPDGDKMAAVRLKGATTWEEMPAQDVKSFVRQNLGRIAFCRVDFGTRSILWAPSSDAEDESLGTEAAIIFKTSEPEKTIEFIERTGTIDVREKAAQIIPELARVINSNS